MAACFDIDPIEYTEPPCMPVGHCGYHHRLTIEPQWHRGVIVEWHCFCGVCGLESDIGDVLDACNHIGTGDTPDAALADYQGET